jgi:CheY-like chemotaxis protein
MPLSVDDFVKLIDATTKLVAALAWPVLVAFVLLRFAPALQSFFESLGEFSLKGAGFEATAKRKAEAAAALAAATAARPASMDESPADPRAAADIVSQAVTPQVIRKAERAVILWVDDRPENNVYERQSLEALGVRFITARSTDEALACLRSQQVDVVISDMGRPPDARAGYTLLSALRTGGNRVPYIIYAGSNAAHHKAEALAAGAQGATNRASELFEYVLSALKSAA